MTAFGPLARALHWITPVGLACGFGLVWSLPWLEPGAERAQAVGLHRSVGVLILSLTVLRLAWRGFDRRPPPLGPRLTRALAGVAHASLYAGLLAIPLLGWTYTNARGHAVLLFGLTLPRLIAKDEYFSRVAIDAHEVAAYSLLGLIACHATAALWHHFWRRDDTLIRMWPGLRRSGR